MKHLIKIFILALCLCSSVFAAVSRDDAAELAQKKTSGGKVLSVEKFMDGSKSVWRVKVLTSAGDVRAVFVDEATGTVH
ncbi:PepSY domain-containing protein [Chitinibacter bivalviorum]|uniref:PepSY domain-containing protein n=1 Tax=Chitinibacter bivalviorum TaxID=2739434 RepID=A0A7H9BL61_9NEIS|nr:PepSY domain-containing protein [Chitinibacter bivalviorum]QLG89132.1 PepSY domain-containing protein [Chitinibacter bivalviorum]